MVKVLLVVHLLITISMVGIILLQRSEGGALGIGGGGGGFMSGRAAGNLLTRSTAVLATVFFATSIFLAILANQSSGPSSLMDGAEIPPAPVMDLTPQIPGSVPGENKATDSLIPSVPDETPSPSTPAEAPATP